MFRAYCRLTYSMARRRFFVDAIQSGRAEIAGAEAHHLTRVLRVEPGQLFEISDNGRVYLAEVKKARKELVSFIVREPIAVSDPAVRTTLLASLIRFERFELILEKATELGVERIIPVRAERSEKGLEQAALKRMPRWQRIVREASEQSRRARLPEISAPVTTFEVDVPYRYVLDEAASAPLLSILSAERRAGDQVALLIGPEGGWTDREREQFTAVWRSASLGPQILRAETAAIAALAVINAAWSK